MTARYQLLERNAALGTVHAIGAPAELGAIRAAAVARHPSPAQLRRYVVLVARPITGGPDIEIVRGAA